MLDSVVEKITIVFHEEVNSLDEICSEFQAPFIQDPVVKKVYFAKLGRFILEGLRKNLSNRIGRDISLLVLQNQKAGYNLKSDEVLLLGGIRLTISFLLRWTET